MPLKEPVKRLLYAIIMELKENKSCFVLDMGNHLGDCPRINIVHFSSCKFIKKVLCDRFTT